MCMIQMQIICCFTVKKSCMNFFLQRGILIRDCSNFRGLQSGYYRIAVKSEEQNRIFAEVLREIHGNAQAVEFVLPGEIEGRSFAIITKELEERGIVIPKDAGAGDKKSDHTECGFRICRYTYFFGECSGDCKTPDPHRSGHRDRHKYGALRCQQKKCLRHMVEWRIVLWRTRRLQERQKNAR